MPVGARLIVLGGPAMLIGLGGGAASSMASGESDSELDFASVQRDNAEMQRRCQEVIDRCWALGQANPIRLIHDVGAGGLSNALPELISDAGRGGRFELRDVPSADRAMSPMEIWCNEAQERYVMAVPEEELGRFREICERERCPYAVVGVAQADAHLTVTDRGFGDTPVDMPLATLLGKPPAMHRSFERRPRPAAPLDLAGVTLADALARVLRFPAVASKKFLITIGDRSITGLVARDQMVGPYQVPVADVAVTLADYDGFAGEAMAMGERSPLAVVNPAAAARMAVAEALTNLAAAPIDDLSRVVLSANWMAAAGFEDEDQALYDAVAAVGLELCPALGIADPVGKDSLSMRTRWSADGTGAGGRLTGDAQRDGLYAGCGRARNADARAQGRGVPGARTHRAAVRGAAATRRQRPGAVLRAAGRPGTGYRRPGRPAGPRRIRAARAPRVPPACLPRPLGWRTDRDAPRDGVRGAGRTRRGGDGPRRPLRGGGGRGRGRAGDATRAPVGCGDRGRPVGPSGGRKPRRRHGADRCTCNHTGGARTALERDELPHAVPAGRSGLRGGGVRGHRRRRVSGGDAPHLRPGKDVAAPRVATGARPRVAILREQGVNGQVEMAAAFHHAGFEAVDVHMSDLFAARHSLVGFAALAACGGFSYGDVLGGGGGWAKSILFESRVRDAFQAFFERPDTLTLGVCNGCQMLCELKSLVPGAAAWPRFVRNRSEQFEGRSVTVRIAHTDSPWLAGMAGSVLPIAVAHGEGRAEFEHPEWDARQARTALRYVDGVGRPTERYPLNPNGSAAGLAGLVSSDGRALVMMPHPERVFRSIQHSWCPHDWDDDGPWLRLFRNARAALG